MLSGATSSSDRPKPSLDKTLEVLRITISSWKDSLFDLDEDTKADIRANVCKQWDGSFFSSLKFLQKLKVLTMPMVAPVGEILHLLPDSLEELYLMDDNLLALGHAVADVIDISHLPSRLAREARLPNLKTIKLEFCEVDYGAYPSCQHLLDLMRDGCNDLDIELEVFRSDPCGK
ncbi:hypothetical protein BFW01_g7708 [Lasiodiplodia theobromae]|nr:hypothetical protein BFW01_g7708 [Lasiodiplodia theobromae]